jgi:hypothetical protein
MVFADASARKLCGGNHLQRPDLGPAHVTVGVRAWGKGRAKSTASHPSVFPTLLRNWCENQDSLGA